MTEYGLIKKNAEEMRTIIFGRNLADAFRRHPNLNPEEWYVDYYEYID
jgi:hypothetical protein